MTATAPARATSQSYANPFGSIGSVTVFILVVALSVAVAFLYCSEFLGVQGDRTAILQLYLLTTCIGWFSFTVSHDAIEFVLTGFGTAACALILIGMLDMVHPTFFWLGLSLLLAFSLRIVFSTAKPTGTWNRVFVGVYVVWVVTGIFSSLGSQRFLKYAQPALNFSTLHFLLDIRYLATACVLVIFVGRAGVDAFKEGAPLIPSLPAFAISGFADKKDSILTQILWPLTVLINVTLFVIQRITNTVWHVIATVAVYVIRIGVNLAKYVLDIVFNRALLKALLRVFATFGILVTITSLIRLIVPTVGIYLLRESWPYDLSVVNFKELVVLAGSSVLVLILINTICRMWELVDVPLPKSGLAAAMLMFAWALSGLVCFSITRFEFVKLRGFHSLGVYTLLFLLCISSVFVFQLCYYAATKISNGDLASSPRMSTWAIGSLVIFLSASLGTHWWIQRNRLQSEVAQLKSAELSEQQREEKRRLREERKKSFLERAKSEGKDVWQTARLANRTTLVINLQVSITSGKTWSTITLQPNDVIVLTGQNSDVRVSYDSDASSNTNNKRYNLITEAFLDHKPTPQEEENAPVNHFLLDSNAIGLYCND